MVMFFLIHAFASITLKVLNIIIVFCSSVQTKNSRLQAIKGIKIRISKGKHLKKLTLKLRRNCKNKIVLKLFSVQPQVMRIHLNLI